ncbi:MAG: phage baseplate assembly protein V [Deltaproteobacteria bacterium]|jgi:Rhs element Vgr protein|nr:phage baseplate assembly protein V [Deltaproteobacteria bacterium]
MSEIQRTASRTGGQDDGRAPFTLELEAAPDLEWTVVSFRGVSALNALYRLDVTALARARRPGGPPMDLSAVCGTRGLLTIRSLPPAGGAAYGVSGTAGVSGTGGSGMSPGGSGGGRSGPDVREGRWHGVITRAGAGAEIAGGWRVAEIRLEPELSVMRGQIRSRVLLGNTPGEAAEDAALASGLPRGYLSFEGGAGNSPQREFTFQHREDSLDFVMRTLEREGLSLSFDQSGDAETAVVRDGNSGFPELRDGSAGSGAVFLAAAPSGLSAEPGTLRIFGLSPELRVPAAAVRLRDWDWRRPARNLEAEAGVSAAGSGEIYVYGENFRTDAEGRRLCSIRSEEELWASERLTALSREPGLMAGVTVEVRGPGVDGRYLVAASSFEGSQSAAVAGRLGVDAGTLSPEPPSGAPPLRDGLTHRLILGRADRTFRPKRSVAAPEPGRVTARIDGGGTSGMPEMDWAGRYRVSFPQELAARAGGRASHRIRMAQPYVGAGYGQNFPLSPGIEVVMAFEEGDPDRPVITGAVPDAATGSPVTSAMPPMSGLSTRGGSSLMFGETEDKQHATLTSGAGGGTVAITAGSPTVASFHAQAADLNTVVYNVNSVVSSANGAGFSYEIDARRDAGMMNLAGIMAAATTALELGSDVAGAVADAHDGAVPADDGAGKYDGMGFTDMIVSMAKDRFSEDNYRGSISDCFKYASVAMGLVEVGVPAIVATYRLVADWLHLDADVGVPDTNLFSLDAGDDGAGSVWTCKPPVNFLSAQGLVSLFILLMGPARTASGGNTSSYISSGVDMATLVASIVTIFSNQSEPATGVSIRDRSSYVSLLSEGFGTFSARGPLVLESGGENRMGDELRFPKLRALPAWDSFAAMEDGSVSGGSFGESRALLLRGKLVRTLCEELSLTATGLVTLESPRTVRLASGPNTFVPEIVPQNRGVSDALRSMVKLDGFAPAEKGISVEVLPGSGAGSAARMCCFDPAGALLLLQGADAAGSPGPGKDAGRRLELSSGGASMRDTPDRSAVLDSDGASLAGGGSAGLTLKGGKATLTGKEGSVELGSGSAAVEFKQNFKASVGGTAEITAGGSGLVLKAPGQADLCSAVLVNFD